MLNGLSIGKIKIDILFLASAQRNCMQPILLSYQAPFWCNLRKTRVRVRCMPAQFLSAAGAKEYEFSVFLCSVC